LFEFEDPQGKDLSEPVKPAGKRFGSGAEGPGKPYIVKMKLRQNIESQVEYVACGTE
jgi:hypothetical protein